MDWLTVVMEEYKSLREESLTSMQTQQSALSLGTATLGAVLIAGFNLWDKHLLPEVILLVIAPFISYLVLIIWLGEVARMMRAGMFLAKIEEKVNKEFSNELEALSWENWLRKTQKDRKTPQLIWNYESVILMFLAMSLFSIIIGTYKASKGIGNASNAFYSYIISKPIIHNHFDSLYFLKPSHLYILWITSILLIEIVVFILIARFTYQQTTRFREPYIKENVLRRIFSNMARKIKVLFDSMHKTSM